MPVVKHRITNNDTLVVTVEREEEEEEGGEEMSRILRSYEFRDLTPLDLKWLDNVLADDKYSKTIEFLLTLSQKLLISGGDLEDEYWPEYCAILDLLGTHVISQRIKWYDFLEFAFTAGKKSFSCLEYLETQPMTVIWDLIHTVQGYYEKEQQAMDSAKGVMR